MAIKLIADSCLDTTPELRAQLDIDLIPLTITTAPGVEFVDDLSIDTTELIRQMAASKDPVRTACPSVEAYQKAMEAADESIVITLSSKLSGSFNAARLAGEMVMEDHPEKKVCVIDSESAAAGELRIALFIDALRKAKEPFDRIVERAKAFAASMHTLFVLEDLSNLVKNGRMSKVKGLVASVMSLRPVLADDGHGEIKQLHVVRGLRSALNKLVDVVAEYTVGEPNASRIVTLSYCNCPQRAEDVKYDILTRCKAVRDVVLVPTSGLSTAYANNGGIIIAF